MKYTPEQYAESAKKYGIPPGPYEDDAPVHRNGVLAGIGRVVKTSDEFYDGLLEIAWFECMSASCSKPPDDIDELFESQQQAVISLVKQLPDLLIERDLLAASNARLREACVQARGALLLDHMVDDTGKPYGTTTVALEAIHAALSTTPSTPDPRDEQIRKLREACSAAVRESNGRAHGFHCQTKSGGDCDCSAGLARAALEGGVS
ncbi:MAG: hypothetical protein KF805_12635 [Phycisphaeraceae bacterium]|nr:hypothetical protein [Phycisphaeraceae bacterium]